MPHPDPKISQIASYALGSIKPVLENIRRDGRKIPLNFWRDEFVLGFFGFLIEQHLKAELSRSERGFVLVEVYQAVTDDDGIKIARRQSDLSSRNPKHPEFAKGLENASVWAMASSENLNRETVLPDYEEAKRIAAEYGRQNDQEFIMELLFQKLFYEPLQQRFSFGSLDIPVEQPEDHAATLRQEKAVVLPLSTIGKKGRQEGAVAVSADGSDRSAARVRRDNTPTFSEKAKSDDTDSWQRAAEAATKARISALEGELEKLRHDRDDWASKAKAAQAASDDSLQRLANMEADLASLQVDCDGWQAASVAERANADDLRHRLSSMSTELEMLRDESDTFAEKARLAETTATDLRQRAANLEATIDKLSNDRNDLMAKAQAGQVALQDKAAETRALNREIKINWVVPLILALAILCSLLFKSFV